MSRPADDEILKSVVAAVEAAADGTGLKVTRHEDLRGASVIGLRVQAYVFPCSSGFQVDLWRHSTEARDPYSIMRAEQLSEAVEVAVGEALTAAQRRAWRARRRASAEAGAAVEHTSGSESTPQDRGVADAS